MSWRKRVKANLASGAYRQDDADPMESFAKGFAEVYVPMKKKEQQQKLDIQKDALKKAKEKAAEEASWKKSAIRLAGEMFPENPNTPAAIDYAYSVIASYDGNVGSATERLESLSDDKRIEITSPTVGPGNPTTVASLMKQFESGSGGYNSLLNQAQDGPFKGTDLTAMTMDEVINFSKSGSPYFNYGKNNVPKGTQAYREGLSSTPMGFYQFVGTTLRDIQKRGFDELGISGATLFDKETQDKLFAWYAKDRMDSAVSQYGDSASVKRGALRSTWEGFRKNGNGTGVSDEQLDSVIKEVETGTFTPGTVVTKPKMKKFDLGAALSDISFDQDGLDKLNIIETQIEADEYDMTDTQKTYLEGMKSQIKDRIKEGAYFKFDTFLEENRLEKSGDVMGAMSVVANMTNDQFRGGEREKNEVYLELKNRLDIFDKEDKKKMMEKASAEKKPMIFYAKNEDGSLNLSPISVMVQSDNSLKQVGTGTIMDPNNGKLVPEGYDASEFIKIYNKPVSQASSIVEDGVAGLTNLLEYRKLTQDNPQAYNNYLTWVQGVGDNVENFTSTFITLVSDGATYQQVELELFSNLRKLTGPAKDIFSRQLQAAYDLARLNGSRGQGLSDNELMQNLQAVGYGEKRADYALSKINLAVDTYIVKVESRRSGIVNGLLGDEDYRNSLIGSRFGIKFNDLVTQDMQSNPILDKQLQLAKSRDLSLGKPPETKTINPPKTALPPNPTLAEFSKLIRDLNKDEVNDDGTPLVISDEQLLIEYNESFPKAIPE